jgi:acetylornithine deacetylase/succinyl-diaminopimelate desuccinylase-like protein
VVCGHVGPGQATSPSILAREFGIARPEDPVRRLEEKHTLPTLNVLAMESGGGVRGSIRSAIPAWATAVFTRVVPTIDPATQAERVVSQIRRQGYVVVGNRDPTDAERLRSPLLARVDTRIMGSASRVSMDHPLALAVAHAIERAGTPPVRLPSMGGSLPFTFDDLKRPTVGVSLVNYDNNQHAPNENLTLQSLWDAIDILASIITMDRPL